MGTSVTESGHAEFSVLKAFQKIEEEARIKYETGDYRHPSFQIAEYLLSLTDDKTSVPPEVDILIDELSQSALLTNIEFQADYSRNLNIADNEELLEKVLLARIGEGENKLTIEQVGQLINSLINIIFTGHPTYDKTPEQDAAIAAVVAFKTGAEGYGPETLERLEATRKQRFTPPTLQMELDQIYQRLGNLHTALDMLSRVAMRVVQKTHPDEWTKINYCLGRFGTWGSFDWDGRKDIKWFHALENRLRLQQIMLDRYIPQLQKLAGTLEGEDKSVIRKMISDFKRSRTIIDKHRKFYADYGKDEKKNRKNLHKWATKLVQDKQNLVIDTLPLVDTMQKIIDKNINSDATEQAIILRGLLKSFGLSAAEPHFRIGAKSAIPALQATQGVTIEDRGTTDSSHSAPLEKRLREVIEKHANLLDVADSNVLLFTMTALAQQMKDEIETHGTARLIVAETHNASTIKTVLLFLKELGLLDNIDVCPLFEDKEGSFRAKEIMTDLYSSSEFREYVQKRGVVSLSLGYSDYAVGAGQFAAGAFHDRTVREFIDLHVSSGLAAKGVKLKFFHIGGNNMARGNHPGGVTDRMAYYVSPENLKHARERGVEIITECSYQGGRGQTMFTTVEGCVAEMVQTAAYFLADHSQSNDIYYNSDHDFLHMFSVARNAHEEYSGDSPDEETPLKTILRFMQNLSQISGSRPTNDEVQNAFKKLRAIRYNAGLIQICYLMTVLGGVAAAIKSNPADFQKLGEESESFRRRLAMVMRALHLSDPGILSSYIELYNPALWAHRAEFMDGSEKESCITMANDLIKFGIYKDATDIVSKIRMDYDFISKTFKKTGLENHEDFQAPTIKVTRKQKTNMAIAHGVRLMSIVKLFTHAASPVIPEIAGRHNVSNESIVEGFTKFERKYLGILNQLFQKSENGFGNDLPAKPSDYQAPPDYRELVEQVMKPIEECFNRNELLGMIFNDFNHCVG
ncbi:MAG: phosphoenolpyruvate carboxylase [Alphaproteobacteria bacterium PRO2]|nr:phosphoenolpyruvate carboxylase [Alphaproteobacteria bacterium PRO2]